MRRRLLVLLIVMALAFGAVGTRLLFVQGVSADKYAAFGAQQRLHTVTLPADRGSIYDRNGTELAMSLPQKTVWADPRLVRDPAGTARALAPVLKVDEGFLRSRLSASAAFVYLARKVDDSVADQVKAMHLDGVSFINEPKRFDPAGPLALPVLGKVGTDNEGLSGVELQYERRLTGTPGQLMVERDPTGRQIASGVRQFRPSRKGDDLVLTLDRSMQYETERQLSDEIVTSHAKGGIAIVMDPRTGEILSLANLKASDTGPPEPAPNNQALTAVYEPGSVNKLVTVSGALEEGLVKPSSTFTVPDHMMVADAEFKDHDPHPVKTWTVTDIVANSSNIGTIMIGEKLGKARIDRYLRAFGFGAHTGLGFPGESAGLLLDPKDWSGSSMGSIPLGQGVAVTALQMLEAYNTIANGGVYVAPKLVKGTMDKRRAMHATAPSPSRRVVSADTAQMMTGILDQVVKAGTATSAKISGYTVAGKTGTARKPIEGGKGYKEGAYVATFAGFVPAENPRLSSIVILDEPTPIYGGLVSAPVFSKVASYGLRLFRVPPPPPSSMLNVPKASADALSSDGDAGGFGAAANPNAGAGASDSRGPGAAPDAPTTLGPSPPPRT